MRPRPIVVGPETSLARCKNCSIRHRSVCRAIDDSDLDRLSSAAEMIDVERGQSFIEEGDRPTHFYNITRGTVKLYKLLPDGRQQIIGFAGSGHFLGLAVSKTCAFSAQAIEPVRLCRFSRPKLRTMMDDYPRLEALLLECACSELVTAQEQMLLLGRKTAQERVASFLVNSGNAEDQCESQCDIRLPMTRGEIADYLGLTIETVSRTFSQFRRDKRIETPSHDRVVLTDRAWLERVAGGVA